MTLNSYSQNWLPIVNTASKIVRRKDESAPLREERRGEATVGRVRYDAAPERMGASVHGFRERE